jgi:hypothetical protein
MEGGGRVGLVIGGGGLESWGVKEGGGGGGMGEVGGRIFNEVVE